MRRQRLQHRAQFCRQLRILDPAGFSRFSSSVRSSSVTGTSLRLLQPRNKTGHRRKRDEVFQLRQFAAQLLGHLLDQGAAERNAAEAALGLEIE